MVDLIAVGDWLRVRAGEKGPVDGEVVVEGRSSLDESAARSTRWQFFMRVEKLGCDTMLSHIVQMVAAAQRARGAHLAACGPSLRLVCAGRDRDRDYGVRGMVGLWSQPQNAFGLVAAVGVLIIACLCVVRACVDHDRRQARGPGRPVDQDGETPERMERVDTLVIDKTAH